MDGFLIDTNVISEFVKPVPSPEVVRWLQNADSETLFASVMTLGEIRLGIENLPVSKRRYELEAWLQGGLPAWFASNLLPVTPAIADRWGRLSIEAKRKGRMLTTADCLIAATALEHNLILATRNTRDFANLGVPILDPWTNPPLTQP